MPSFTWSSRFREGQWRVFRKFLLEERRDAGPRFRVIDAERRRIGNLKILFVKDDTTGSISEKRAGLSVSEGSSLEKLLSAYVALGGNPFDISMFLSPGGNMSIDGEVVTEAPDSGAVLHSQNIKYSYDQGVGDGDANLLKFKSSRMGGKKVAIKEFQILNITSHAKKWISKEIFFKRTRLEENIIKLCDLREQLDEEVEELVWATRGEFSSNQIYDPELYTESLTAASICYFLDTIFRVPDTTDPTSVTVDNTASSGDPGSPNLEVLAGFEALMSDEDEEDNTAL